MPDYNTLIPIAAPAVALIGSIAALFGVWLTQKNNRETKLIELEANRKQKLLELREESARMIRQEKREAYLAALKASRISVGYAVILGQMSLGQQLKIDVSKVDEASKKFQALIPELELVSSQEVNRLFHKLYTATGRCQDTLHAETEKLHRTNAHLLNPQIVSQEQIRDTKQQIFGQVQAEVQKVFEEENTLQLYNEVRNQIRQELGFMALDPKLVPTAEEQEALRREINTL